MDSTNHANSRFVAACEQVDIVSGSRYLKQYDGDSAPPADRLFVNRQITKRIQRFVFLESD